MITLCVFTYIIISLCIAWHKYHQMWDDINSWEVSKYYENEKKSLLYGFFFLPALAAGIYITVMIIVGIGRAFAFTVYWIITNMP